MQPLRLDQAPPRAPRAELAGIIFLPRTIDKIRATLPGGSIGAYQLPGFSEMQLEMLGIPPEDLTRVIESAASEEEVEAFVLEATTPDKIAAWNDLISKRLPRNGDRNAAYENYPWLRDRPDLVLSLDVLAEDDRLTFA